MKVYELAKELNMNSKDVLEKISAMGIEAKNHMSVLSDMDTIAVKNTINRAKAGAETKIVKVMQKKVEAETKEEEPRVVVKAAAINPVNLQGKVSKVPVKTVEKNNVAKPPMGKPVMARDLDNRQRPPIGKPVPKDVEMKTEDTEKNIGVVKEDKKLDEKSQQQVATKVAQIEKEVEEKPMASPIPSGPVIIKKADPNERNDVRPPRRDGDARPPRRDGDSIPPRRDGDSRPPRRDGDSRPPRRDGDSRPPRRDGDSRPPRRDGDSIPPRRDGDARPPRRDGDSRPPRRDGDARPPRRDGDARPPRRDGDSRPPRRDGDARPPRRDGDRPVRKDLAPKLETKPIQKKMDDKPKNKEHDKFAKLEHGPKKSILKTAYEGKSLEKQAKPKKHQKQTKVSEEIEMIMEELPEGTIVVNVPITVAGFCEQAQISTSSVIMSLMKLGIMANINQNIDEDTVLVLSEELGVKVVIGKVEEEAVEEGLETFEDKESDLKARPPIITVMGHVDHGKTSLLDAIRKTNVTSTESGGITQHIGASEVTINGQKIVFLDTPGHEAFTAMRARGAHATDIAVLVVAADDSVKPQTIESISHAKAAGVPIIIAMNKMDKPGANPDKVKQDLTEQGLLVEEWGGDIICVPVSAKTGEGIVNLLEMILLQAEVLELKANPNRLAMGTVIEARLDKSKGPVATLLVLNGSVKSGMSIVAGTCAGKIRLMTNFKGDTINTAGPATAVEILGLTEVPQAGDEFNAVKEDKMAREIAENRRNKLREEVFARNSSTTLEKLFTQIQEGEVKELNLIIKGDVMGSVGALVSSLEKLKNENVRVKIIHTGVGTVTESDVMLAGTSGAVVIGFNVRPSTAVSTMAERDGVEIRTYRVIYDVIDDVENAMRGMLDPIFKEVVLGKVEVRNTFKVPGVGIIAGAYVTEGKVVRNAQVRLVRDGIVIHEGKISSLKRFKDDAKEVNQGFECGLGIENYNDLKEMDIVECFQMEEIKREKKK